jgi:Caspase domain
MLVKVRAVIVLVILALLPSVAHAEGRFALLIGNQSYDPSVGVLKNPHNVIAVVGDALAKQAFEVLLPIRDAKRSAILGGVRNLVGRLNAAGAGAIGFIYYSGHGAAKKDTNINYLIPVDAKEPGSTAFWEA